MGRLVAGLTALCVGLPTVLAAENAREPVVIAVIDDAFNVSHELFDGMRWRNAQEQANNQKDDDANGFVDDVQGWDAADQDGFINPPHDRVAAYSHGTFMAGIIAQEIRQHLGNREDYPIKLMFVKALSDFAGDSAIKTGYRGVNYAATAKADVINLSWSGGAATQEANQSLQAARDAGAFVISSVGNHPQQPRVFPAAHDAVFGVAGVDDEGRLSQSNYGEEADLAANASEAKSADATGNNSYRKDAGVSIATARVSAAAALMKLANRDASNLQIKACLQMSSTTVDALNPDLPGQLGAGQLNTQAAIDCITSPAHQSQIVKQPEGILLYAQPARGAQVNRTWAIQPDGDYNGLLLKPFIDGDARGVTLKISTTGNNTVLWQGAANELPSEIALAESNVSVSLSAKRAKSFTFGSHFKTKLRELSKQFCHGRTVIDKGSLIEDGSGTHQYANRSHCEWLVQAPLDHHIALTFERLDTQLHTDYVYLFHGQSREQRNLLMRLSGNEVPPKIVIKRPTALIWFVTNESIQGDGFAFTIDFEPNSQKQDSSVTDKPTQ